MILRNQRVKNKIRDLKGKKKKLKGTMIFLVQNLILSLLRESSDKKRKEES